MGYVSVLSVEGLGDKGHTLHHVGSLAVSLERGRQMT